MQSRELTPLVFEPILKERVWGGRLLGSALGRRLPEDETPYGESWELVDLEADQSVVRDGPLAGSTLGALVARLGERLLGHAALDGGSFPLLIKLIHAASVLSVQVHPDAETARRLGGRPKSEAWYILEAEPGASLYLGLAQGVDRASFERAMREGRLEELLVPVPARAGDLVPVRPGTVHAIGAGVLLAEVQQPSDTTYRVFDWNRLGLDGKPRTLHEREALESIHFDDRVTPLPGEAPQRADLGLFVIERVRLGPGEVLPVEDEGPVVLVGLEGRGSLGTSIHETPLARGDVVLLPSACRPARLYSGQGATALVVTLPPRS
jgi:mannose-6-phosphate isomerase